MLGASATGQPTLRPQCKTVVNAPGSMGVRCPTCNRQYCLKHRLAEDHDRARLVPLGARPAGFISAAAAQSDRARSALAKLRA